MLCMNVYPREYVNRCRSRLGSHVAAYESLVAASPRAAVEAFESTFFNNLVLVMDSYFTHRSRTLEKKDGTR